MATPSHLLKDRSPTKAKHIKSGTLNINPTEILSQMYGINEYMGKKNTCKANKMKEREIVNYRITVVDEGNYRDFLVSGDDFDVDGSYVTVLKGKKEVAAFRSMVAIENMNEALAWGEKFEKMAMKDCCDPLL